MAESLREAKKFAGSNLAMLETEDVAATNLICAGGLPGADPLAINGYLAWLDAAAEKVRQETERNYHKFLDAPGGFKNSQARYCIICLITVLQRQFGVGYNLKWKGLTPDSPTPESFGIDARDLFIHAIIDGIGGTCGSLPVLYVAVGRRLGYPLYLVKAARHLFVRWDDPHGKHWHHADRFNIEATGPGVHFLSDDFYRTWPRMIAGDDIAAGIFLRSLTPREELAEFLATRGYCLQANRRFDEAIGMFSAAARLSPRNRHFVIARESLRMHFVMRKRGHAFLNASIAGQIEAVAPFWMNDSRGQKMLVQIISPVAQTFAAQPDIGQPLIHQTLQTPNGLFADVWLPLQTHFRPMTAHWVSLSDGRQALIHRPVDRNLLSKVTATQTTGQPIVPVYDHRLGPSWMGMLAQEETGLPFHEAGYLGTQIQQTLWLMEEKSHTAGLPKVDPLAISATPNVPYLPSSSSGISLIN